MNFSAGGCRGGPAGGGHKEPMPIPPPEAAVPPELRTCLCVQIRRLSIDRDSIRTNDIAAADLVAMAA